MDIPFCRMENRCDKHFAEQKARSLQYGPLQPHQWHGKEDVPTTFLSCCPEVRLYWFSSLIFCCVPTRRMLISFPLMETWIQRSLAGNFAAFQPQSVAANDDSRRNVAIPKRTEVWLTPKLANNFEKYSFCTCWNCWSKCAWIFDMANHTSITKINNAAPLLWIARHEPRLTYTFHSFCVAVSNMFKAWLVGFVVDVPRILHQGHPRSKTWTE